MNLVVRPSAHASDDPFLPHGAGTWKDAQGAKSFIYDTVGPAVNMKVPPGGLGYGNALYLDKRGEEMTCRPLAPFEVWRAHGHSGTEWRQACNEGKSVESMMQGCAHSLPQATADAIVDAAQAWVEDSRAGVGPDADEDEARTLTKNWMRIWRENPLQPGPVYQT